PRRGVRPQRRDAARAPAPAEGVLVGGGRPELLERTRQARRRGRVAVGREEGHGVEEEVPGARWTGGGRRPPGCLRDAQDSARDGSTGELGGGERLEVGVPCERHVERLE